MTHGLSQQDAARLADDVEAAAFRAMFAAAPAPLKAQLGLRTEQRGDTTLLFAPAMPTAMFNRAIGLGLREPASLERALAIAGAFAEAGAKTWWLHWNPQGSPADFGSQLLQAGWRQPLRRTWVKMLRTVEDPPRFDTPLFVRRASPGAETTAVARIAVQAFDMPPFMVDWLACLNVGPWRTYAVTDGDTIVGGGCLHVEGDCGWLGVAAMAPSHRGRSGQAALMAHRIAETGAAGARYVVTETGEPTSAGEANPSLANMQRCAFEPVASRWNLELPG